MQNNRLPHHNWFTNSFYELVGDSSTSIWKTSKAIFYCFTKLLAIQIILITPLSILFKSYNTSLYIVLSVQMILLAITDVTLFMRSRGHTNQIILCIKLVLYLSYLFITFLNTIIPTVMNELNLVPSFNALVILVAADRIASVCKELSKTMQNSSHQTTS